MRSYPFQLLCTKGNPYIFLRELNGNDELLIQDTTTPSALTLINNLLVQGPTGLVQMVAEKISIPDRDRLLSGIYKFSFGNKIESTIPCSFCNCQIDINFDLNLFEQHNSFNSSVFDEDGYYKTSVNRFRLPTGEDELSVWGLSLEAAEMEIFARCTDGKVANEHIVNVQETMEKMAPVFCTDLLLCCPDCSSDQTVQFDIQSFLLTRINNLRRRVTLEIHCLASHYRWSHREILELPRSLRQQYASLIGLN